MKRIIPKQEFRTWHSYLFDTLNGRIILVSSILLITAFLNYSYAQKKPATDFKQFANKATETWINSILQKNNSAYYEATSTLQRIVLVKIPATADNYHTLKLSCDAKKSTSHAYDFITGYDQALLDYRTVTGTDFINVVVSGENLGPKATASIVQDLYTPSKLAYATAVPAADYSALNADNVGARVAAYDVATGGSDSRRVQLYGDLPITNAVLHFNGYTGSSDKLASYTLSWTSASENILILMAGHLAIGTANIYFPNCGYGAGLGSANINGGPYHFNLDYLDTYSLGSQDNQIKDVTIFSPCSISPSSLTICQGGTATFTASAGLASYSWSISPTTGVSLNSTSGQTIVVTGTAAGSYTLTLSTGNGDKNTQLCEAALTILPSITVNAGNYTVCTGSTVTLSGSPLGGTWSGPHVTGSNFDAAGLTAGVYTINYMVTNGACTTTSTAIVTVYSSPAISGNVSVCRGSTSLLTGSTSPALNNPWTTSNSLVASVNNTGTVTGISTGSAIISYTNVNGCTATSTITINPPPIVAVNSTSRCSNGPAATITASPSPTGAYTYAWQVPTGVTNPGNVASFTTMTAGTYMVTVTDVNGCNATSSGILTVNAAPTVHVSSPSRCSNLPATITATPSPTGAYTYAWQVPTGVTNPGNVASFSAITAGTFTVTVTDANECTATGILTINAAPTVHVNSPSRCSNGPAATITASPSPTGAYTYAWQVPTGVTNPGNVASFTTMTAGTYMLTVTDVNGCIATGSGILTVISPTVNVNSTSRCSNGPAATITASPSPAGTYTYAWQEPTGVTNPGNVASFTTMTAGTYIVTVTDANGCTATGSGILTVNSPRVNVNSTSRCSDGPAATITASPSPAGAYTYAWQVPSGVTNPGNVASFSAITAGTYMVTVTDANGCTATGSGILTVNAAPTVHVNSLSRCSDGPAATITASPSPAGAYTYAWQVPTGVTNPGNVASFTTLTAGTFIVTVTDANGCTATSSGVLTVNSPTVHVNSTSRCSNGPAATITASPSPTGAYTYAWQIPTGVTNPGNVASFTTMTAGTYIVTITDANECIATGSGILTVNAPTVNVNSPSRCSNGPAATITATPSPTGAYTYTWQVPTGVTNPGNVASFSAMSAGTYIATVTDANGCIATGSGIVTVNAVPTVNVNSPSRCSNGPAATITANPSPTGAYIYAWQVPTGVTNPGNVASFTTMTAGTYMVTVTDANGCIATGSGILTVNSPTVNVNSTSRCSNGPAATITASPSPTGAYTYAWQVPTGVTNPGNVASFSTITAGTYIVTVTDANECTATSSGVLTINAPPTVHVNSTSLCSNSAATVTATPSPTGAYTYAWQVPTGVINPGNVASFITITAGTYIVTATDANGCTATGSGTVTINAAPTVHVSSPSLCSNLPATITATPSPTGAYTYAWQVPSGVTNPGNVASFTTMTAGTYMVTVTDANGCTATSILTVNAGPTVHVNSPSRCSNGPAATITASPSPTGAYTYTWQVSTGVTNPGNVASFSTMTAGTYTVTVTDANGCNATSSGILTVNAAPTVHVSSPSLCSNLPATITATPSPTGAYTYAWQVPTGVTNPGNVASFTTLTAGTFIVTVTDANECTATGILTINAAPTVQVNSPSRCSNGPATTVTATPTPTGAYTYAWQVPTGVTNPGNVASFSTMTAGTYMVTVTDANGCIATGSGFLTVNAAPTVHVNSTSRCSNGLAAVITATPSPIGAYSYEWQVPTGVINPGNVASFITTTAGTYMVTITDLNDCMATGSGIVTVNAAPSVHVNSTSLCFNTAATITATPSPTGAYTYVWQVPTGVTNPGNVASFSTTIAGIYIVMITDVNNCTAADILTINAAPTVHVNSPSRCSNGPAATITASLSPIGAYTYTWQVPTGVSNPGNVASFSTMTAGNYTVTVTDANGCTATGSGFLTVNAAPIVNVNSTSLCSDVQGASITASPSPTGTYTYAWQVPPGVTNPGNVASFTTSTAGTYTVTITNGNNCSATGTGTLTATMCVTYGCTLGFWKNHTAVWDSPTDAIIANMPVNLQFTTSTSFSTYFPGSGLSGSMLSVLKTGGGGCQALARNAIASLLSKAAFGSQYAFPGSFTDLYNTILSTLNAGSPTWTCNSLNSALDAANNNEWNNSCSNLGAPGATKGTRIMNEVTDVQKLNVIAAPNPFTNKVRFIINSPEAGHAQLDVVNMLGQRVATVFEGNVQANSSQQVEYNVPSSAPQNMMYILRIGNQQVTGKLLRVNQ